RGTVRGVLHVISLLALNDAGAPMFDQNHAAAFAALGIPAFACTPDLFPDLMAAAIQRQDISLWVAAREITTSRGQRLISPHAPQARQGKTEWGKSVGPRTRQCVVAWNCFPVFTCAREIVRQERLRRPGGVGPGPALARRRRAAGRGIGCGAGGPEELSGSDSHRVESEAYCQKPARQRR